MELEKNYDSDSENRMNEESDAYSKQYVLQRRSDDNLEFYSYLSFVFGWIRLGVLGNSLG